MEFTAGDDWEIRAWLIDQNGVTYDLTTLPPLQWLLIDSMNKHILDETNTSIAVLDALAGEISISVAAPVTEPLGGLYTDWMRIVQGGVTSTLFYGSIYARRDPWTASVALPPVITAVLQAQEAPDGAAISQFAVRLSRLTR